MALQQKAEQHAIELVEHWRGKVARGIANEFEVGNATITINKKTFSGGEVQWFYYVNNVQLDQKQLVQALTMTQILTVMMESVV